jgi:hypothetical protein
MSNTWHHSQEDEIPSVLKYQPCDDLWVVTTYFNPAGYHALRKNHQRFAESMAVAGIRLLTVECAIGDKAFELPDSSQVIQVRTPDAMWLKERLLNFGIEQLPPQAQKVAWIDCDLLFRNPAWALQAASLLDRFPVVQLFDSFVRLDHGRRTEKELSGIKRSFSYAWQRRPGAILRGIHYITGGAWAARRSLIHRHGLYEMGIVGGGDNLFAYALAGGFHSRVVRRVTVAKISPFPVSLSILLRFPGRVPAFQWLFRRQGGKISEMFYPAPRVDEPFFAHYLKWARRLYLDVHGRVGCVPGMAVHLWHGDGPNRQYLARHDILKRNRFNPETDVMVTAQVTLAWASDKPLLHQEVAEYFLSRQEDEEHSGEMKKT